MSRAGLPRTGTRGRGALAAVATALVFAAAATTPLRADDRTDEPEGDPVASHLRAAEADAAAGRREQARDALRQAAEAARVRRDGAAEVGALERRADLEREWGDDARLTNALWDVGFAHVALRQWGRALVWFERSREAAARSGRTWAEARMESACGETLRALGRHDDALVRHQRALSLYEATDDARATAQALAAAARALRERGHTAEAAAALEWSAAVYLARGDRPRACRSLLQIADIHASGGATERALEAVRVAEAALGGTDHAPTEALLHARLAEALARLGDGDGAWAHVIRAVDRACATRSRGQTAEAFVAACVTLDLLPPGDDRVQRLAPLRDLAVARRDRRLEARVLGRTAADHLRAGRAEAAEAAARAAVERADALPPAVGDEIWTGGRGDLTEAFGAGAVAAGRLGDAEAAFGFLEASRADALLDHLAARAAGALPTAGAADDLRPVESGAVESLREAVEDGDLRAATEARRALDDVRDAADVAVERAVRSSIPVDRGPARRDSLADVRRRLGPGDVYVAVGVFDAPSVDAAVAVVAPRDGARAVHLGAAHALREPGAPAAADPAAAARLRARVADPLALPADARVVLFSPDGPLASASPALLFPGRDVVCVPSATVLGRLADARGAGGEGVLALGDPDYDAVRRGGAGPAVAALRSGEILARVAATGDEARAVGDVVLTGRDATERGLRAALAGRARWRAVHLACHGVADDDRPLFSALALAPEPGDDGLLTALDVFRSHIPADLVTLSACETGRGAAVPGEGSVGLARAFLVAGATRVVASLWKVDDAATAALMSRFYAGLRAGAPPARALREAQDAVRADPRWEHPRYWAAWAIWGAP